MADASRPPEPDEASMPKWVYVVGGLVILIALAFAALHLSSGGIPRH